MASVRVSVTRTSWTPSPPGSSVLSTKTEPLGVIHTSVGASTLPSFGVDVAPSSARTVVTSRVELKQTSVSTRSKPHATRPSSGACHRTPPLVRSIART